MDASQYKDYVLVLLFVKYVSDKYAGVADGTLVVPEGSSFDDLVALKESKDIGDQINKRIQKLLDENGLAISFADFNDEDKLGKGKEMVDRLTNLIGIFENPAWISPQPRRRRRYPGRCLRIPDAPLCYGIGQKQGTVLYACRSVARHGQGHRHHTPKPGAAHLRSDLWLGFAFAQSRRRSPMDHDLRAGDGQRDRRTGPDEHDPARQSDGGYLAGQYAVTRRTSRTSRTGR